MENLRRELQGFDRQIADEIISDYEEHFEMGVINSKTEDQICTELGDIRELVEELRQLSAQSGESSKEDGSGKSNCEVSIDINLWHGSGEAAGNGAESDTGSEAAEGEEKDDDHIHVYENMDNGKSIDMDVLGEKIELGIEKAMRVFEDGTFDQIMSNMGKTISRSVESVAREASEFAANISETIKYKHSEEADSPGNTDAAEEEYTKSGEHGSEQCDSVIVVTQAAEVIVSPNSKNQITFDYKNYGSRNQQLAYRFSHERKGNTVYARVDKVASTSRFFSDITSPEIVLRITVPNNIKLLSIQTLSGDVKIRDTCVDHTRIETASGEIEGTRLRAAKSELISRSGDMTIRYLESNDLVCSCFSGDVDMSNIEADRASATSRSGDVRLARGSVGMLKMESTSGDLDCLDVRGKAAGIKTISGDIAYRSCFENFAVESVSGDAEIENEGKCEGSMKTVSGDVTCKLCGTRGYRVSTSAVSGDIRLMYGSEYTECARKGEHILGEGESRLRAWTVSGDIEITA